MRRRNYEVFYYLHHVYLVLFIATLMHAASAWYYLIGGLSLWFFDRCMRAYQRGRQWRVRSIEPLPGGVTALDLAPGSGLVDPRPGFKYSCGQYIYINVPEISSFEWHPFTISSAPSDGKVTCHIKMAPAGSASFTGKLLGLANSGISPQVRWWCPRASCFPEPRHPPTSPRPATLASQPHRTRTRTRISLTPHRNPLVRICT